MGVWFAAKDNARIAVAGDMGRRQKFILTEQRTSNEGAREGSHADGEPDGVDMKPVGSDHFEDFRWAMDLKDAEESGFQEELFEMRAKGSSGMRWEGWAGA